MRAARAFAIRLWGALKSVIGDDSRSGDAEAREELAAHLAMHTAENVRRGMTPADAHRAALLATGGLTASAEAVRERRGLPLLENLATDIRYAMRGVRNKPGFALAVILTLALGIGANTAMFTILNAVVLRPLPYPDPDRIVSLTLSVGGDDRQVMDELTYAAWRASARTTVVAASSGTEAALTTPSGTEQTRGRLIGEDYFAVFGSRPVLGRVFTADDRAENAAKVVIISESLWRNRYGADPAILGKTVDLDGVQHTVVGVMPATFTERHAQFWTPLRLRLDPRRVFYYVVEGRLRPGVSFDNAVAELRTIARRVAAVSLVLRDAEIVARTLHDRRFGDRRKPLLILFAAVVVLLLIACANLANLNLARANSRRREVAVRLALGAGRWRLVRSMLCESLLLSLAGAALGVVIARTSVNYLVRLSPTSVGNADSIGVDTNVLLFTLAIAVLTGVAFGLSPAVAAARQDINEVLGGGGGAGGRATGGRRFDVARRALVVA
jgi:predicted permease